MSLLPGLQVQLHGEEATRPPPLSYAPSTCHHPGSSGFKGTLDTSPIPLRFTPDLPPICFGDPLTCSAEVLLLTIGLYLLLHQFFRDLKVMYGPGVPKGVLSHDQDFLAIPQPKPMES